MRKGDEPFLRTEDGLVSGVEKSHLEYSTTYDISSQVAPTTERSDYGGFVDDSVLQPTTYPMYNRFKTVVRP